MKFERTAADMSIKASDRRRVAEIQLRAVCPRVATSNVRKKPNSLDELKPQNKKRLARRATLTKTRKVDVITMRRRMIIMRLRRPHKTPSGRANGHGSLGHAI